MSSPGTHIGIQLRITTPAGPLLQADSDMLHHIAKFAAIDQPCRPDCPPGCTLHGWHQILKTVDGLTIEGRPVELPDSYPED